jgi:[ribosomal protein S5]-alanine N-acetyltransferase
MYKYRDGLESDRLLTRFLVPEDHVTWAEFFDDTQATEFILVAAGEDNMSLASSWIGVQLTRYNEQRYGLQAITDKKTGEFLGMCGLLKQTVDNKEMTEVGYHFLKKHWGKGYAPEAVRLFIDYAFANDLAENVVSLIHVLNSRSQRVAEKNVVPTGRTFWREKDIFIYSMQKTAFNKVRK